MITYEKAKKMIGDDWIRSERPGPGGAQLRGGLQWMANLATSRIANRIVLFNLTTLAIVFLCVATIAKLGLAPTTDDAQVVAVQAGFAAQIADLPLSSGIGLFLVAATVTIGFSLILAATISAPLSNLALAAERGRSGNTVEQMELFDLTARPDEIGQLSVAMRIMASGLCRRIDQGEHFAADVAHEIRNPLASLRSAVGTLRVIKDVEQQHELLNMIDHDVQRMDRLITDISNASQLDANLTKDEHRPFDLIDMVGVLEDHLGKEARKKDVKVMLDLPCETLTLQGMEARLAQVFVNLITNAVSFCGAGDTIWIRVRQCADHVVIAVEDTGPGISEEALTKVFKRFYSARPAANAGDHSGLGLAISKQIVEAHGGAIWAENIQPAETEGLSGPTGARFVVELPI